MPPELSKYQKFEMATISRGEIQNAPYNPRAISSGARSRLKAGLKRFGLSQPLVWNKRTGHLVAGHQRISILDTLERTQEYALTVAVVDLPLEEEVVLNVQMNNDAMMGEWDTDLLRELQATYDVPFEQLGFSQLDVQALFPDLAKPATELEASVRKDLVEVEDARTDAEEDEPVDLPDAEDDNGGEEGLERIREAKRAARESLAEQNDRNFYFTVTCENRKELEAVLALLDLPLDTKFVEGQRIRDRLHQLADGK